MKRLLAYLLIVLGLGLTVNVSTAKIIIVPDFSGYACVYPVRTTGQYSPAITYRGENIFSVIMNNVDAKSCSPGRQYSILKSNYPNQFLKLEKYAGKNISKKDLLKIIDGTLLYKIISNRKILSKKIITKEANETRYTDKKNDWRKKFELIQNKKEPSQTQITQTESSQTLKVENTINPNKNYNIVKINFCVDSRKRPNDKIFPALIDRQECSSLNYSTYFTSVKFKPSNYQSFLNQTKLYKSKWSTNVVNSNIGNKNIICFNIKSKKVSRSTTRCFLESGLYEVKYDGKNFYWGSGKTQIAKAEPTVKPKKKVKVVKKESKQEEFKPKKTNQDNEAPVIEIAEAITVNDSSYEFKGKVTDKAKTIYVEVDGRSVEVKKGQFLVKGYTPIDKQISITAIDQWGNKSKPKLVNIVLDQKDTIVADMFEALDPSKIRSKSNKNRVALIIGIEKYNQTPDATFANLDAQYFYEYARKGFGISKSNIKLLVDEDANLVSSLGTLSKWLPGKIKSGETELIIFFAGHGLASNDGKELYLLPQDSDPDLLTRTALSRTELFREIIALNPKSVTMFLDTCYSGVSRDERTLLASARPVRIVADEQDTPNNFTIFSASQLDQISSGLKEAKHGIFSYYLMKGLEGKADTNKDKDITNGELLAYMDQNVAQKASELGRQQNPSLAGDPDKILMSYR